MSTDHTPSDVEQQFIDESFGIHGSCACDGATDSGCPLCTPEVRQEFLTALREFVARFR